MPEVSQEARPQRRIIVGVDGSPNSLAALQRGAYLARDRGACLDIAYVIPPDARPAEEASGYQMLEASVQVIAPHGLGVPADRVVVRGDPARILVQLSGTAELLVVGGRLRCEHGDLLGGDVLPYCLKHAGCPVAICADQRAQARYMAALGE
jgi:nucleotide-binding universal stress UspA family protein